MGIIGWIIMLLTPVATIALAWKFFKFQLRLRLMVAVALAVVLSVIVYFVITGVSS
ncbi:MAG TPA: hypothetical protein VEC12_10865 [Bacteroidia bacterium]|nr:hypothetical protein [Bacteroidia bacterium]